MKKTGKVLLAAMLSLSMAVTVFPQSVLAENAAEVENDNKEVVVCDVGDDMSENDSNTENDGIAKDECIPEAESLPAAYLQDEDVVDESMDDETEESEPQAVTADEGDGVKVLQDGEKTNISEILFDSVYLLPGMKKADVKIETNSAVIVNSFEIWENGKVLGDKDTINSTGDPVRVDVTFTPKDGCEFKKVGSQELKTRVFLTPKNKTFSNLAEKREYSSDNVLENNDGSFTATWNYVAVNKPVGTTTLNNDNQESFAPEVGKEPVEPTLLDGVSNCTLEKYEWTKDYSTPMTGTFEAGQEYRLHIWLKAKEGYSFNQNPALDMYGDTSHTTINLLWTDKSSYKTWVYNQSPELDQNLIAGTMIYVQIIFKEIEQHPTDITVSPNMYTFMDKGETTKFSATVTPDNAKNKNYSWSSSDESVAKVDSTGKVKAVGNGTCYIIATTEDGGLTGKAYVVVAIPPEATSKITLSNTASGIKLKWKAAEGAEDYEIQRNGTKIATVKGLTYTDKEAVTNGAKYTYKIVSCAKTVVCASKSKTIYRLSQPAIKSLKNSAAGKMTVKWGKNSKASGYKIQYSLKKDFSNASTVTVKGKDTVSKTIKGLKKGKTYYVRIRTYKTVKSKTYYSAWSAKKSLKIKK